MNETPSPSTATPPHPLRRSPLHLLGWAAALAAAAIALIWQNGLAFDLMFAIMHLIAVMSGGEIGPIDPTAWDPLASAIRVACALAALALTVRLVRADRRARGACVRCGRPRPVRFAIGRRLELGAAWTSVAAASAYSALKLQWALGGTVGGDLGDISLTTPGFTDTAAMGAVGIACTLAMAYGRPRLPRRLVAFPAVIGCLMLLPVGVMGSVMAFGTALTDPGQVEASPVDSWVWLGIYPVFLTWGVTMALVVRAHLLRTRPGCPSCGE